MIQRILEANGQYDILDPWFEQNHVKCVMLVCGESIKYQNIDKYFRQLSDRLEIRVVRFTDFQPNPLYQSVVKGVNIFHNENCEGIIAVGGGSAMDVAKCIKLYSNMEDGKNYLEQKIIPNNVPFLAIPTTAGSGSEATKFAVIYYEGEKQSVSDLSCIPGTVLMDSSVLKTLPEYQKKATKMDTLCHAIESFWSVNSTKESRDYSRIAIKSVMDSVDGYFSNTDSGNAGMLFAANMAGKAINIAQTTAGHAMCYKITNLFGCAHGHSAALCNRILFPWMLENTDGCIDPRGEGYLKDIMEEIGQAMGCKSAKDGSRKLEGLFKDLKLEVPKATDEQFEKLRISVNPVRLKNHPIALDISTIDFLYRKILDGERK